MKATSYPNHGMICEQNVEELKRKNTPHPLSAAYPQSDGVFTVQYLSF